MLFMAVTSSGSAELIAVSSLTTYDVYRTYINPEVRRWSIHGDNDRRDASISCKNCSPYGSLA